MNKFFQSHDFPKLLVKFGSKFFDLPPHRQRLDSEAIGYAIIVCHKKSIIVNYQAYY